MENKKQSSIIKNSLILCMITLVAGLMLGFVYELTKDPIEERRLIQKQESYRQAYGTAVSFESDEMLNQAMAACQADWNLNGSEFGNVTLNEVMLAKDASGAVAGYIISTTSGEGYGGDISVVMGVSLEGRMEGLQILEINETAGLGANADTPEYLGQYTGKTVESYTVVKTGAASDSEIDAITSATITSNAVTSAVNAGLDFLRQYEGGK